MTFERRLKEIGLGRGDEDKKSKRLWDEPWHGGWCWEEALQGKQRRWHRWGRKKCQLFLKHCCSLSIWNLFSSSTALTQVASTTSEKYTTCPSCCVSHSLWTSYGHRLSTWLLSYLSICQPLCLYMPLSLSHHFYHDPDDDDSWH